MREYVVTQYVTDYVKVGDDYQHVEAKVDYMFNDWDDVQNFIGYAAHSAKKRIKFEIGVTITDEA